MDIWDRLPFNPLFRRLVVFISWLFVFMVYHTFRSQYLNEEPYSNAAGYWDRTMALMAHITCYIPIFLYIMLCFHNDTDCHKSHFKYMDGNGVLHIMTEEELEQQREEALFFSSSLNDGNLVPLKEGQADDKTQDWSLEKISHPSENGLLTLQKNYQPSEKESPASEKRRHSSENGVINSQQNSNEAGKESLTSKKNGEQSESYRYLSAKNRHSSGKQRNGGRNRRANRRESAKKSQFTKYNIGISTRQQSKVRIWDQVLRFILFALGFSLKGRI